MSGYFAIGISHTKNELRIPRELAEKLLAAARQVEAAEALPTTKAEVRWCPECDALTKATECPCQQDEEGGVPTVTIRSLEEELGELQASDADDGDTIRELTARAEAAEARVVELQRIATEALSGGAHYQNPPTMRHVYAPRAIRGDK